MSKEIEVLARKGMEGDQEAKEELLLRLRPLVIAYSKRYGGRQGMDEDAFQDGMLEILGALEDYDIDRGVAFLAYITSRMRYYYHNRRRREKPYYYLEERLQEGSGTTFLEGLVAPKQDVEDKYLNKEKRQEIMGAIDKLTPVQRQIIKQYYFDHKNLRQIAERRGVHLVTIAKTKARALENLKKYLRDSANKSY